MQKRIYAEAGQEFKINSPKQLGDVLFGRLGLRSGKKTSKGAFSTRLARSSGTLRRARGAEAGAETQVPRQAQVDLHRPASQAHQSRDLENTHVLQSRGNFHRKAKLKRSQSSEHSDKDVDGRRIRNAFVAEDGSVMLSADYSQIEIRLLAHFSGDPALTEAIRNERDLHTAAACEIFAKGRTR